MWFLGAPSTNGANSSTQGTTSGNGTKNGTITTTNPLFFIMPNQAAATAVGNGSATGKQGSVVHPHTSHHPHHHPALGGNLVVSRSQIFTSQTNLPLQILTASSAQEGRKPKLRRFNSHDTSANMFSVADFENARLARRNEIEMKQRMQQMMKMNSLSSGGDCSTGDSKGSKYSNDVSVSFGYPFKDCNVRLVFLLSVPNGSFAS